MRRVAGATLLLLAALAPTQARAEAAEDHDCHDGHITSDPSMLRPGAIVGKEARNHFYGGPDFRKGCPGAGAVCRRKGYVVRGDKVIVAEERAPGLVCAGFISSRGTVSAGWLPEKAVNILPASQPAITAWLGKWRYLNSNLSIERSKTAGALDVSGDSWSKRYQSVNTGDLYGEAVKPEGNVIAFAVDGEKTVPFDKADKIGCAIKLALIHDVMVVEDNGNCGGAGVYFGGIYRRRR